MLQLKKFDKILIVKLSSLGDIINTLPVINVIKTNLPKTEIGWVVEDRFADILSKFSGIDRIFVFKRKKWRNLFKSFSNFKSTIREVLAFIRDVRKQRYSVAVDLQGNLKSGLHTFMSGAETRVGFAKKTAKELNHMFTNKHVSFPAGRLNRLKRNLIVFRKLGFKTFLSAPYIDIPGEEKEQIRRFLADNVKNSRGFIVFHPGTSAFGAFKRWSIANYIKLGDMIKQKYGTEILITWAGEEKTMAEAIYNGMKDKPVICMKTETIKMLAGILRKAKLCIGGDTGPLHLANLLGVPTIALFGPKDPVVYGPYSSKSITVCKELACSPCKKRNCEHPDCMSLIEPEDVIKTLEKSLEKNHLLL